MIDEKVYQKYMNALLAGKRQECREVVTELLDRHLEIKEIYTGLFQRSLYQVGELWETNQITVANEHLATSITESLLNLVYPSIFAIERKGKKAVISCSANEFHQVGGRMVADIFELNGWDSHFLGANTTKEDLVRFIHDEQPDVLGLSLSILSNINHLKRCMEMVRGNFPNLDILIGGQAFRWGGTDLIKQYEAAEYISSLHDLEEKIKVD